jgi:hypothetical protein
MAQHATEHSRKGCPLNARLIYDMGLRMVPVAPRAQARAAMPAATMPAASTVGRPSAAAGVQCPLEGCRMHFGSAKDLAEHTNKSGHAFHYGYSQGTATVTALAAFGVSFCGRCRVAHVSDHVCREEEFTSIPLVPAKPRHVASSAHAFPRDVNGQTATTTVFGGKHTKERLSRSLCSAFYSYFSILSLSKSPALP